MSDSFKLSNDGSSIDFKKMEALPSTMKKFRQSREVENFYRFVFENDLRAEAFEIVHQLVKERKLAKSKKGKK